MTIKEKLKMYPDVIKELDEADIQGEVRDVLSYETDHGCRMADEHPELRNLVNVDELVSEAMDSELYHRCELVHLNYMARDEFDVEEFSQLSESQKEDVRMWIADWTPSMSHMFYNYSIDFLSCIIEDDLENEKH